MKLNQLTEASLSRVWQHLESDRPVGLLTAFRGEFTRAENVQRNKQLAATLRQAGYGYFFVDGYWVENQGTDREVHVAEDSIFAIGEAGKEEEFKQTIVKLGNQYNQDAVIVKDGNGIILHTNDGGEINLGSFQPGNLAQAYTKLRTNKKSNTFVFESERDDESWISKLAKSKGE